MNTKDNMTDLGSNIYVVRTQAGFKKACKDFLDGAGFGDDNIIREKIFNYPTVYPALVALSIGYEGYEFLRVQWVNLNAVGLYLKQEKKDWGITS